MIIKTRQKASLRLKLRSCYHRQTTNILTTDVLTADRDVAVLPADVRLDGEAPRFLIDAAGVAARVARVVQHRRQVRPKRMSMRVLVGPPLARQTAVRNVYCTAIVASVALVTVNWNTRTDSITSSWHQESKPTTVNEQTATVTRT